MCQVGDVLKLFVILNLSSAVPGAADNSTIGVQGARLKIKHKDLKETFDKVIPNTLRLAESQVNEVAHDTSNATVDAIVVVGGFGCCQYLQKRLRESEKLKGIPILVPPNQ
jgi:tRNA A37 threonylcarbamoyltransferase TsaD